jgi:hypothetical protein
MVQEDMSVQELLDEAKGRDLGQIAKQGIGAYMLALVAAAISGLQTIVDLLLLPFEEFYKVGTTSISEVFIEPWNIVTGGGNVEVGAIEATAEALAGQFGFLSLPVANFVVLLGILVVVVFIALGITSNFAPGVLVDNPIWDAIFGTPEEEGDDEG